MQDVSPIFNRENTEWRDGNKSLILGQHPALLDSINRKHDTLFSLYKGQKSADWSEDEISLRQSLLDFQNCPEDIANGMIENIAYQWETDSLIGGSIVQLLGPFITDSDLSLAIMKFAEIENLHSLTYSEIVKLAIPNPERVFERIMYNGNIKSRGDVVTEQLTRLKYYSSMYALGKIPNNQELYDEVFMGLVAIFCLERLQFMSSFAHTFAIVEQGYFKGIGMLVQKIMQDEYYYHAQGMKYVLKHEMTTSRGMSTWTTNMEKIKALVDAVVQKEYSWNEHIFSISKIPNLNKQTLNHWVEFNSQDIYDSLMLEFDFKRIDESPLDFMTNANVGYLNLDGFQNANQEGDNNNYSLNSFINDVESDKVYRYY